MMMMMVVKVEQVDIDLEPLDPASDVRQNAGRLGLLRCPTCFALHRMSRHGSMRGIDCKL